MSFEPNKKGQSFQFSDSCILVQETIPESETNEINISCSSQLIVFIALLDCLMSMSCHQIEVKGIITLTSSNSNYRLTYLSHETRQNLL